MKKNQKIALIPIKQSKRGAVKVKNSSPKEVLQYPINDMAALQQLEASQKGRYKFRYDFKTNKNKAKLGFIIAPNNLMGGRLGVYAGQDIKKSSQSIGRYAGKRSKGGGAIDSLYTFQISDDNNKAIEYIDADKIRDWSGFINHSPISNVFIEQRKINGLYQILFYLERDIKKGEQLLYDYGEFYFNDANIKPFYLHSSDNWQTTEEVYLKNKIFYANKKFVLDKKLCADLQLECRNTIDYLLPSIFLAIGQNKFSDVKKIAKKSYPIDLLAYTCEKDKICPNAKQQHLTALMFACYLGHADIIKYLIDRGEDVSRRMLNSGYSSFDILMLGNASLATAEDVGKILLNKMHHIPVLNQEGLSALHYAIVRNSTSLVKLILRKLASENLDWLRGIFDKKARAHAAFDYCLQRGQFAILKSLLKAVLEEYGTKEDSIIDYINRNLCFNPKSLAVTSHENLQQFMRLLSKPEFKVILKKTKLATRLKKYA